MLNFSISKKVSVVEEELLDICINAISDFMSDEYDIEFVDDVSADDRRLIYAKVGAALIDLAGSEVIK